MNKVSDLVLKGEEIKDGIDLGVPGYEKMTVIKGPGKGIIIQGQAWVDADKSNYKDFPF